MTDYDLFERLDLAISARAELIQADDYAAFRLFAGFYEGFPDLAIDCFARTLVLHGYANSPEESTRLMETATQYLTSRLPWVNCIIQKYRTSPDPDGRRGRVAFGSDPASHVLEHGIWYAIDLLMNQDTSLYLDTRNLRGWLMENSKGKSVLNLFAYTGALGVAALAGDASRVVQVDRSRKFMELARRSCQLNQIELNRMELFEQDFFNTIAQYKRSRELFDLVIVDPPYLSTTGKGRIDLEGDAMRVVNKVRPLVNDGGILVAINNALFQKGTDYLAGLEELCQDGYLKIETIIPVPEDFTGYPATIIAGPPVDPAPFNHPTKIVVLKVKRKAVSAMI